MRADEKIDPQLELDQEVDQVAALEEQEEVEDEKADEVDTSSLHFHEIAGYIEALLEGGETDLASIVSLTETERAALEMLAQAITGRRHGQMVYADDRLVFLNQALAALQPTLAAGFEGTTFDGRALYESLVGDMAELKDSLESLSDAQGEVFAQDMFNLTHGDDGAKPKPKPKPPDAGEVGDDRPSTLAAGGPVAPEVKSPPSTLAAGGPAAPDKKPPPSTLDTGGPAAPDVKPPPSTLAAGGPAAPEPKPQPSTAWDGDPDRARR